MVCLLLKGSLVALVTVTNSLNSRLFTTLWNLFMLRTCYERNVNQIPEIQLAD